MMDVERPERIQPPKAQMYPLMTQPVSHPVLVKDELSTQTHIPPQHHHPHQQRPQNGSDRHDHRLDHRPDHRPDHRHMANPDDNAPKTAPQTTHTQIQPTQTAQATAGATQTTAGTAQTTQATAGAASSTAATAGSAGAAAAGTPKVSQAAFIHKLYSMLEDATIEHLISWSASNDSFIVSPGEEFSKVLRQYFKHTNVSSFVRQLNMYGFHKVNDTFTFHGGDSSQWEFKHGGGSFKRGDVESLRGIKRRASRQSASQRDSVPLRPVGLVTDPGFNMNMGMNGAKLEQHVMIHPPVPDDPARIAALEQSNWQLHETMSRMASTQSALMDTVRSLQTDLVSLLEDIPRMTEGRPAVDAAHQECQRITHSLNHRNAILAQVDDRRSSQTQPPPYFYQYRPPGSMSPQYPPAGQPGLNQGVVGGGVPPQQADPFHRGSRGRAVSVYFDPLAKDPNEEVPRPLPIPTSEPPLAAAPARSQRPGSFPLLHRQDKTEFVGGGFAEALKYRTDAPTRRHTASGVETMPLPQYNGVGLMPPTSTPHPQQQQQQQQQQQHEPSTPPPNSSPHTPYQRSPHPSGESTRSNSSSSTRGASVAALLNPEGGADKKRKVA